MVIQELPDFRGCVGLSSEIQFDEIVVGCVDAGVGGVAFKEAHGLVLLDRRGLRTGVDVELIPAGAEIVVEIANVRKFVWRCLVPDHKLLVD